MTREEVKVMGRREIEDRLLKLFPKRGLMAEWTDLLQWLAGDNRAPCLRHAWGLDIWEASAFTGRGGELVTFEDKDIGVAVMRLYVYCYAS